MLCPHCQAAKTTSTVTVVRTTPGKLKRLHYWDEQGEEHHHNPNVIVTEYECSNGHRFAERSSWECGVCGYKACTAEIVEATEVKAATERQPTVRRAPVARKGKR